MRYCSALGCYNAKEKADCRTKTFFKFPLNNPELLKEWCAQIRREGFKPSYYSVLCSDHFEEDCFSQCPFTKRRILKPGSVPTQFQFRKKLSWSARARKVLPSTSSRTDVQDKQKDGTKPRVPVVSSCTVTESVYKLGGIQQQQGSMVLQELRRSLRKKNIIPENIPKETKALTDVSKESGEIQPPCSPRCHIAAVQRPSVQCAICLCFFHPNCIPKLGEKVIFACKSCTTQKLALYEKERKSFSVSEPSLSPDDSVSFDPNIDISLLSPEVLLSVRTEPITFPSASESGALLKNSSSNIPQVLSGTISSAAVKNVHQEIRTVSSPHLLSHLLQPTVVLNSGLLPLAPKPTNQNLNSSTARVLLTKEAAAKILQVGMRLTPGTNLSAATPLFIKRLPDGRRIAVRGASNPTTVNNSTLQNPVLNVNSNFQILSNTSEHVNSNLLSSRINQTEAKASANIVGNVLIKNVNFLSPDNAVNSIRISNLLTTVGTGNEFSSSKNFKSSSTSNNASESGFSWDMNKLMTSCKSLLLVFKRLSIPDLLRASQVCSYWKYVASQSDLWERISFQGLTITDWEKCCLALQKNGTKALDLRGIVHQNATNLWGDLEIYVVHLAGIEELIFDQITPSLLKNVAYNMPLLRKLECHFVTTACSEPEIWTVSCEWELSSLRYLGRLVKLKIGSGSRIELKHGEDYVMPYLPQLRHVALTGFSFCSNVNLEGLSKQKELISLELGDCKEIEPGIYALLENLTNLKSLRLENGGSIDDCRLSEALIKIKGLEVLELMNFKISKKLSEAFKDLKHLIHLNVWPDNTDKAAVVNKNLFHAISSCKDLKYLCWGVIAEGEYIPQFLEMENSNELTFENLFNDLVALFPEGRVEVKCAPRSSWREFCSTRK
ncbi:hypothetical protein AVEN_117099-1 [Araneus ventricosus]|uniref:THAP-type domain-containing protein n=1 Tax=Araneus ventricosus TaxID=182803 RepID=A0A4Y2KX15_ARAVE|nr:hypothetical protein AVEN_117099-1 [Araneus ventricosus]